MAADPPKPDPRVIVAYLDDVVLELDAAKRLVADPPNRLAAFHLQQAAEKLVKAVRIGHGLRVTADLAIRSLGERQQHPPNLRILERMVGLHRSI
jgi:HEPN domain-containing protein